jgi:hypothetical protein
MGKVIPRSASPERIFKDFNHANKEAHLKGGEPAKLADVRLVPLAAAVATATADVANGTKAVEDSDDVLMVFDGVSDLEIGASLDEAWNALGRPASSIEYTLIAGRGKSQWTDGDPRLQPILMTILAARFRQSTAAVLQAGKEGWAQRVEAKAADQLAAATKLQAAEATLMGATGIARGVADLAQVALARFKRDLNNAGLTETQIHDIIPSYEPKPQTPPAAATPATPPAGAPTPGGAPTPPAATP